VALNDNDKVRITISTEGIISIVLLVLAYKTSNTDMLIAAGLFAIASAIARKK
jgi:hypothetical protein